MTGKAMVMKASYSLPLYLVVLLFILTAAITIFALYKKGGLKERGYSSLNLFKYRGLKRLFKARPFQFSLQLPMVIVFILIILTGLYGDQNPGRNFATIATWTIWWTGVIFLILFLGAGWCLICPWSALSDWIERVSFWKKREGITLGYRWPRFLRNRYLMTIFLIVITWLELGIFITYNPRYTAYLALVIFLLTLFTILVFERKTFCRYVCFVGGIVGMYSNLAPVEVRSKDHAVCNGCKTKDCIWGNEKGYGCPIFEYPGGMSKNTNCILCTECFKTCPYDNMSINLRHFFTDLSKGYRGRLDESMLALTLLGLTIFHGFTMLPVWFEWAVRTIKSNYYLYLSVFTLLEAAFIIAAIGIHYLTSHLLKILSGKRDISLKAVFIQYSYAFLPVAIFYHLSHNLAHLDMEGSKIMPVLSDPFGWGWNVLGTRDLKPYSFFAMEALKHTQLAIILIGLIASIYLSHRITLQFFSEDKRVIKIIVPAVIVIVAYSFVNMVTLLLPMVMRTVSYF